jgi:outer membrane protein assembly factor BamB
MNTTIVKHFLLLLFVPVIFAAPAALSVGDWPDWRGPNRDGVSREKNLPEKWSLSGQNLAWKAPYGGRSAPIVLGDHLYLQNTAGKGETEQERVMCFNADTGKMLWEHRFNIYQATFRRIALVRASPAADPATGNVYVFGVNGTLLALSQAGKLLWGDRSMKNSICSPRTAGARRRQWSTESGDRESRELHLGHAGESLDSRHGIRQTHRRNRLDQHARGRPFDTDYSQPTVARINGTRLLITGLGDGGVHAIKISTGEPVWHFL